MSLAANQLPSCLATRAYAPGPCEICRCRRTLYYAAHEIAELLGLVKISDGRATALCRDCLGQTIVTTLLDLSSEP